MKTICSCEGITLVIYRRACLSYLWDLLHISHQLITLSAPMIQRAHRIDAIKQDAISTGGGGEAMTGVMRHK